MRTIASFTMLAVGIVLLMVVFNSVLWYLL